VKEAKKEKNDNKLLRLTILALLITIIAVALVSGTFAKYTTTVSGTDTATVAKWSVELNGTDVTKSNSTTFDLFGKTGVYDLAGVTNTEDLSSATATIDDEVIKSGKKVAPGTWGKVSFAVANKSEVAADYAVTIDTLTTTLPLKFSIDGKDWKTVSEIKTAMGATEGNKYSLGGGTLAIGSTTPTTGEVDLYWKWDFNVADDTDTALGAEGTATCTITAGVTFTQVD